MAKQRRYSWDIGHWKMDEITNIIVSLHQTTPHNVVDVGHGSTHRFKIHDIALENVYSATTLQEVFQ